MSEPSASRWTDDPMADLEAEKGRLGALGRVWKEETTTVRAKDNSFSMTFDGRGDLTGITFHGTKYRTAAPAEHAHLLVETLRRGRLESLEKMAETMGGDVLPGIDFVGLATGKVDPNEVVDALVAPLMRGLDEPAAGAAAREPRRG